MHLALSSPGLGPTKRDLVGSGANQAVFAKIAMPLGHGVSAGATQGLARSYEFRLGASVSP